jgi:dUTP pyrophosphatase
MIKIKLFTQLLPPAYKTDGAAAMDICTCFTGSDCEFEAYDNHNQKGYLSAKLPAFKIEDGLLVIPPRHRVKIPTGIFTECDIRLFFAVVLRSSFAWETGCIIPNAVGVIDSDYRGQWFIVLFNPTDAEVEIKHGQRIAQLIPLNRERIEWDLVASPNDLKPTDRGAGGFGSTNK